MIERQIDNPMPIPLDFVVKKAPNSRFTLLDRCPGRSHVQPRPRAPPYHGLKLVAVSVVAQQSSARHRRYLLAGAPARAGGAAFLAIAARPPIDDCIAFRGKRLSRWSTCHGFVLACLDSSVLSKLDFAIAAIGFFLLTRWKIPPLAVVVFCAFAGGAEAEMALL
jgi:hypothetical protein